MNRIRLLSEQVANQIAAGEVVERPASVVKELVENALDAQPSRISVDVQAGGRSLIRVTDDGVGMSRDDALLCLERHATSKIRRAEDLAAVATMGFRGEALPSIASVSRFTLTTRERDADTVEATQVNVAGGKILDVRSASGPSGTSVEVRQLFFNLPARRKFLRSEETERVHIQHYLLLAALAFPEVGFTFTHNSRLIWQLPPLPRAANRTSQLAALRERLRALYGSDLELLPVDFIAPLPTTPSPYDEEELRDAGQLAHLAEPAPNSDPSPSDFALRPSPSALRTSSFELRTSDFRLWGFLGAPGLSRATREDQHLFVNRRPVENRGLNFALLEGYHTALMKGRYPVCCLFLELDPADVDVNIHPAKREVKFHAERQVRALVTQAVRQALLEYHAGRGQGEVGSSKDEVRSSKDEVRRTEGEVRSSKDEWGVPGAQPTDSPSSIVQSYFPATTLRPPLEPPFPAAVPTEPHAGTPRLPEQPAARSPLPAAPPNAEARTAADPPAGTASPVVLPAAPLPSSPQPPPGPQPLLSVPLRLVGVIGRLYVVLESDRGLVLLDQHAAHERILFEQMLAQLEQGNAPSQRLLLAETVEVSARDAAFVRELLPTLTRLGVGLSEFGERTFLLEGLPPYVRVGDARQFVLELVDQLKAAGQEVNALRLGEQVVAKTVCRHAVKANDPLSSRELERLVEDLRRCAMPYTCPHGRPTLIELNYRELEKKFGRTQ
ncbi:MAG: DNA mismatch repair endonuclease MutL [Verrucomicrobiales bacterium]|nr:DNA mismatch repair endonuclease MutL [Verrucomicrobiales bacterium]